MRSGGSPRRRDHRVPDPDRRRRTDGIAVGPDGNLWFTEAGAREIGQITPTGTITEFRPAAASSPGDHGGPGRQPVVRGAQEANQIGRITPAGRSASSRSQPPAASGRDCSGPRWQHLVRRVRRQQDRTPRPAAASPGTSSGDHPVRDPYRQAGPAGIAAGPDGNLWFAESGQAIANNKIGRITPAGRSVSFPPRPQPASRRASLRARKAMSGSPSAPRTSSAASIPAPRAPAQPTASPRSRSPLPKALPTTWHRAPTETWFAEFGKAKSVGSAPGAPEALTAAPTVSGGDRAGAAQTCSGSWASWASLQPSESLFGFDGYHWLLDGSQVAVGNSYTPAASTAGHQLSCSDTVTYPLPSSSARRRQARRSSSHPYRSPVPLLAPTVTAAHESASTWRLGAKLARISRTKPPIGTTFSFALNEPAAVKLAFTQRSAGRRVGRKCVAKSRKNARRKTCTRTVTVGTLAFTGHSGTNKVAFQGRISSSRKLKPGRYALIITAKNSAGARSTPVTLTFTIVR